MVHFTLHPDGIAFSIKVVPGASRDKIAGEYDGGLKVTVSRPPEDGAANRAVEALLAKQLQVPRESITITHGHSRSRKIVRVTGMSVEQLRDRLGLE